MKKIVFARKSPTPRLYNEALSLKKVRDYKLIFLCETFNRNSLGLFNKVFNEIICLKPPVLDWNNYGLAQNGRNSPKIHHLKNLVSPPIDRIAEPIAKKRLRYFLRLIKADMYNCRDTYEFARTVIENVNNRPVIMDLQDGNIVAGIQNLSERDRERDKYCFENVAGIIHRGPQSEIEYYKKFNYEITCPTYRYLDYCNKEFFADPNTKKLSEKDGEFHLVSMGAGMNNYDLSHMINRIVNQKIHYHLYLVPHSWVDTDRFKILYDLSKSSKYFHMERPISFNKVPQEIAKYDFGVKIDSPDHLAPMQPEYLKIGVPYRRNTYLEAGLPIISSVKWVSISEWTKKHNIGFSIKNELLENLHEKIHKCNYDELRKNVLKLREEMLYDKYAEGLAKFYDEIFGMQKT